MKRWFGSTPGALALGVLFLGGLVGTAQAQFGPPPGYGPPQMAPAAPPNGYPFWSGNGQVATPYPHMVPQQAPMPARPVMMPGQPQLYPPMFTSMPGMPPSAVAMPAMPVSVDAARALEVRADGTSVAARAEPMAACPMLPSYDAYCEPKCPQRSGGLMAGGTIYFLKPHFEDSTAYSVTSGAGTNAPVLTDFHFDWDYELAPAMWLGWSTPCGLGIRARYFQFEHASDSRSLRLGPDDVATTVVDAAPGLPFSPGIFFSAPGVLLIGLGGRDLLRFGSDLEIQIIDGEATYELPVNRCSLLLSGGGRYLHMAQNYSASLRNEVSIDGLTARQILNLRYGHNFSGGGPTMALQARYTLGDSGLSLFGLARGSLLVGTARQNLAIQGQISDPDNLAFGNVRASAGVTSPRDDVLPIGEIEVGFDYGVALGNARPFIRGAIVNQTYFGAGSASTESGNLSLFGFQGSVGINY